MESIEGRGAGGLGMGAAGVMLCNLCSILSCYCAAIHPRTKDASGANLMQGKANST